MLDSDQSRRTDTLFPYAQRFRSSVLHGICEQELQLARLVAAEAEPGAVVTLDQQARPPQRRGQPRQFFQGRGEMGEGAPRYRGQRAGQIVHPGTYFPLVPAVAARIAASIMRKASSASAQCLISTHLLHPKSGPASAGERWVQYV